MKLTTPQINPDIRDNNERNKKPYDGSRAEAMTTIDFAVKLLQLRDAKGDDAAFTRSLELLNKNLVEMIAVRKGKEKAD